MIGPQSPAMVMMMTSLLWFVSGQNTFNNRIEQEQAKVKNISGKNWYGPEESSSEKENSPEESIGEIVDLIFKNEIFLTYQRSEENDEQENVLNTSLTPAHVEQILVQLGSMPVPEGVKPLHTPDQVSQVDIELIKSILELLPDFTELLLPVFPQLLQLLLPVVPQFVETIVPLLPQLEELMEPVITKLDQIQDLPKTFPPTPLDLLRILPVFQEALLTVYPKFDTILLSVLPQLLSTLQPLLPDIEQLLHPFQSRLDELFSKLPGKCRILI